MIIQLYTFSPSSYVVADEWNANFQTIYSVNAVHAESIVDGFNVIAFPNSDFSNLFASVYNQPNSSFVPGNLIIVKPQQEYYTIVDTGQTLNINIGLGLNSEARVIVQTQEDSSLCPFNINYSGTKQESYGKLTAFPAGTYVLFIYETNGLAQIKITKMGA